MSTTKIDEGWAAKQAELVEGVKAHALAHYDTDGWDIVVETMDDEMIQTIIWRARTVAGAVAKMAAHVGVTDAVRADIVSA